MTYIKNANSLSEKEYRELKKMYMKYFREVCVECQVRFPRLNKLKMRLNAERYSDAMLERIKSSASQAFVSFLPRGGITGAINGFITGYLGDDETTVITHFFVDVNSPGWRREHVNELYKRFALYQKSKGAKKICAKSAIHDHILTDYLETLNFEVMDSNGDAVEYGRQL